MAKAYGTDYPNQIDVMSDNNGVLCLHLIQADVLDDERIIALQEKLNNYLVYILDGQLADEYPAKAQLPKVVIIELQHQPTGVAADFINAAADVFEAEGIGFECRVRKTGREGTNNESPGA